LKLAKLNNAPEIFHSIQGEGKSIGKPSVFIRFSLCNLYCIWCDTDYTWNWENTNYPHNNNANSAYKKFQKKDWITTISVEKIFKEATKFNCENIIVTGGEPMVQHKELVGLLNLFKNAEKFYNIEIETNGTLQPNTILDPLIDQYNVSVKLSNSKVKAQDRINHSALSFFSKSKKSNFKFVVDTPKDLEEILELQQNYEIKANKIYLMPQGTNAQSLLDKQQWLVEICKQYQFNYTDRLHIHIYGSKKGV